MAWDKGFNFRNSSGWVTDGADETYVLFTDAYPTTRNGVTFGWEEQPTEDRDRGDGSQDRRLGGVNFVSSAAGAAEYRFRVDLPATGAYDVRIALGDMDNTASVKYGELRDTTTLLKAYSEQSVGTNHYDVEENPYSAANWPGSNAAHQYTFATQICRFALKRPAGNQSVIEHLSLSQVAAPARGHIIGGGFGGPGGIIGG